MVILNMNIPRKALQLPLNVNTKWEASVKRDLKALDTNTSNLEEITRYVTSWKQNLTMVKSDNLLD
uniref:Uncharacterized protein n=1 Tax=Arion vulgaris TaxID=1028688 RepID=A0A0B6ZZW5_9EUPU